MSTHTPKAVREAYELGMQAGRKELKPAYTAMLEALKAALIAIGPLDPSDYGSAKESPVSVIIRTAIAQAEQGGLTT